jgi:cytochrome oxidase assembly protein ShyY1
MILPYLIILCVLLFFQLYKLKQKEGFVQDYILAVIVPPSPVKLINTLSKKIRPFIPYKKQFNRLKRQLRMR